MARYPDKLTIKVCIEPDGKGSEAVPWLTVHPDGTVERFLPQEKEKEYEDKIMKKIGKNMSRYIMAHPDSTLWEKTND